MMKVRMGEKRRTMTENNLKFKRQLRQQHNKVTVSNLKPFNPFVITRESSNNCSYTKTVISPPKSLKMKRPCKGIQKGISVLSWAWILRFQVPILQRLGLEICRGACSWNPMNVKSLMNRFVGLILHGETDRKGKLKLRIWGLSGDGRQCFSFDIF